MSQKHLKLVILIITSALSLIWLTAHLWEIFPLSGQFTQRDPDAVLFARLLEQSILKGQLIETDSYGCYPYEISVRFPPFYLWFLYRTTLAYFVLFPSSQVDPMVVAGFLPIVVTWVCGIVILLGIYRISRSNVLFLLCCFFMLPGSAVAMASGFFKFDYDFLNAFCIWLWIISYLMFYKQSSNTWALVGALAVALFLGTWTGTPLFFFFATLYGATIWICRSDDAEKVLNYLGSTMLTGSMVNLLTMVPSDLNGEFLSLSKYSYFQPGCVLAGGLGCLFLRGLHVRKISRGVGIAVTFLLLLMLGYMFSDQLLESTGIILRRDPIHKTISELRSSISFSGIIKNNVKLQAVIDAFGWSIILFPFFSLMPWRWCEISQARFLRFWLCLMIILSCYQIRYLRWIVMGCGLYYGITFYLLWNMLKSQFDSSRKGVAFLVIALLPFMVMQSTHNYYWIKSFSTLKDYHVELFSWIRNNTPETSGYSDDNRPEYGILANWDEGNYIGFYARRPSIANNAMWGFKTMADIFSAKTENDAAQLCSKYGVRYVVIPTFKEASGDSYSFWPMFRTMPEKPEYTLLSGEIIHDQDYKNFFYFWLMENLALTQRASFNAGSYFRLVYVSKSPAHILAPYLVFEKVAGAKVVLKGDASTTCQISLELMIGANNYLYKKSVQTDSNGFVDIIVPYSTSHKGGRIETQPFYKISFYQDGKFTKAKLHVAENDIIAGLDVSTKLEVVNDDGNDEQSTEPQDQ
ncbi:MAG: hypothetical protein ACD_39C01882G0004 [uncultured bacterium]|nr:MAG: hypothetical protein ACD_39C01882G0004 [uncultured bacterium]